MSSFYQSLGMGPVDHQARPQLAAPAASSSAVLPVGAQPAMDVYDLRCYSFSNKEAQFEKDKSVKERMKRMEEKYKQDGMRRSVEAVLLVHQHGHPHVLLLQIGNHMKGFFKLPGGRCRNGEREVDCLKRKLTKRLAPLDKSLQPNFVIGECISVWYRPTFETYMYPYSPPHIQKPKECKKVYIVPLPERCMFAVPNNLNFLAIPFFELYDNSKRYGPIISSIPQCLSRYNFNYRAAPVPQPLPPGQNQPPQQQQQQQQQQMLPQ